MRRVVIFSLFVVALLNVVSMAFPQKIRLVSNSANNCFNIESENIRDAKENSIVADLNLKNLTSTWFLGIFEKRAGFNNAFVEEGKIPPAFLIGPKQTMKFNNIEFFDEQCLFFSFSRDATSAPSAVAILAIDVICRGLFTEPLSLDNFFKLHSVITVEGFEALGKSLGRESVGLLFASISSFAYGNTKNGVEELAQFIISTKDFKKELWDLIRFLFGEKNSVLRTILTGKALGAIIEMIDVPQKITLLTEIAKDSADPNRVVDDLRLVALAQPCLQLASSIQIKPSSPVCYVGSELVGAFTIKNIGLEPINIKQLTIGGRGPDGVHDFQDFTVVPNILLQLNQTYSYLGTLILKKPGKHYFKWVYQTQDGQWKNRLGFESWLWPFSDEIITIDVLPESKPIMVIPLGKPGKPMHVDGQ